MLFNSIAFAVFLPLVFAGYWLLNQRPLRLQNAFLLVASYVFYGWWDWRFLFLLAFSSSVDYLVSLAIGDTLNPARRKALLWVSLVCDLGILGFFKYFNFFIESFAALLEAVGLQANLPTLRIILPVGISFYTFQSLSYTIDVYRREIQPVRDPIAFFAFVSFFPQLVAGPIERAGHLLPQFLARRSFDTNRARDGLRQALWGLFKKVVIADNLAVDVDHVFGSAGEPSGPALAIGAIYFATQIYCDFSGYSDVAIGVARLFGFDLARNFALPYFSRDMAEFWRRWHISLSTWFRDYVYIPLGGSRVASKWRRLLNVMVTFTVSGLWHGADWKFVVWGLLNGALYALSPKSSTRREGIVAQGCWIPSLRETWQITRTFFFVLLGWVFFRASSLLAAFHYLAGTLRGSWVELPENARHLPLVLLLFAVEWIQRDRPHALAIATLPTWGRWIVYYVVCTAILMVGNLNNVPFIYFQF